MNIPWLSIILWLPLAAGLIALLLPRGTRAKGDMAALVAIIGAIITLALSVLVYIRFDNALSSYQFEENVNWLPSVGASYHLGVDGISLGLMLLTAFLAPLVLLYLANRSDSSGSIYFAILALETSLLGVLLSADLLLFYVFWEAMLIPMYFLISVWGGERRAYGSLKFILYMMVGSLLMLVGILWFYWWYHAHVGPFTFNLSDWILMNGTPGARIPHDVQLWMFGFFFISFAIKVPLFPFHSWLPDAQAEGPVAFNVMLVEVGAYAFIRFCLPLFPAASLTWAPAIMTLAVINVIYGAVMAIVQQDMKRLFAYAGMSHAGFIILGIFSLTQQGIEGSILYMINSGLTGAGLFFIADLLYRRRGSRAIRDFGGMAAAAPVFFFVFMVTALAAIGLPGLNGFTSEFLVLVGAIRANAVSPVFGYFAASGVVLSSIYMLWMFQRVMYGRRPAPLDGVADLQPDENTTLWPLIATFILIGVWSALVTQPMQPSVNATISAIDRGAGPTQTAPALDLLMPGAGMGAMTR
ncbi:MAG TPA: NADH-quinone oxidoreductase subunit M [Armatimonadota bacterium]|nr:NADH-quinone oxidoreductase subunit M [Armatimonadota bacterium]